MLLSINQNDTTLIATTSFEKFFQTRIIPEVDIKQDVSRNRKITNIALKSIAFFISAIGKIPSINIIYSYAGSSAGGLILLIGDFVSFTVTSSWALFNLIDELTGTFPRELLEMLRAQQSLLYRTLTIAFSVLFALCSKASLAFIAYKFNNENVWMPVLVLLSTFSLTAFSVKQSLDLIFEKIKNDTVKNKLLHSQGVMVKKIKAFQTQYNSTLGFLTQASCNHNIDLFFEKIYDESSINTNSNCLIVKNIIDKLSLVVGSVLTLSYLLLMADVALVEMQSYFGSLAGGIVLAVAIFFGNMYVAKTAVTDSLRSYMRTIFNCCNERLSYYQEKAEFLFHFLLIAGIVFAFISWGTVFGVVNEYVKLAGLNICMSVTSSLAKIVFTLTPMMSLVKELTKAKVSICHKSDNTTKNVLNIDRKLRLLMKVISNLNYNQYALMISKRNQFLRKRIISASKITMNELNDIAYNNE